MHDLYRYRKYILLAGLCSSLVHSTCAEKFTSKLGLQLQTLPFKPSLHSFIPRTLSIRGGEIEVSSRKRNRKRKQKHRNSVKTTEIGKSSSINKLSSIQIPDHDIDTDLPCIKAILIPRKISIQQVIRLISAFLFTSSLLEALRTSGMPYTQAVKSTLEAHGMKISEGEGNGLIEKISPLDEYFARKICQGENNLLPPKYFPASIPLAGLVLSMFVYVGLLILFPKWIIKFNVWMNFIRVDTDPDFYAHPQQKEFDDITSILQGRAESGDDKYYQSQFINRDTNPVGANPLSNSTGLAVLVQLSKQEREISSDGKSVEIRWLYRSEGRDHPEPYFIEVGQRRVYIKLNLNSDRKSVIECRNGGPTFYHDEDVSALIERGASGLSNREAFDYACERYGAYNDLSLPIPTVEEAFISRLSSPLAVLQIVGRILTALEESLVPALMNILMTLGQHYMNAKRSIISAKELSSEIQGNVEGDLEIKFWTLRPKVSKKKKKWKSTWIEIPSSQLLPGDVFYLPSSDTMIPVDALLLEGSCIAQEAVVTGESVPQAKTAIEPDDSVQCGSDLLSIELKHRNSVLFAGTTIMQCDNGFTKYKNKNVSKPIKAASPIKCLALKTGSYSSKGEIVRALSKNNAHAGSISTPQSDRDSLRLIIALSTFAMVACMSLFVPTVNSTSRKTSGFRRVIQCTRIAIASIPSDLPLAINHVVHSCAQTLRKEADVVCSEPGSLLKASKIDMVVFDKTGTLSADTQTMTDIVNLQGSLTEYTALADIVLAGCHSLSSIKGIPSKLIGDPLDVASLDYSSWDFNSTDKSARIGKPSNSANAYDTEIVIPKAKKLWQIKTFPFDATKRRSFALLLVEHENGSFRLWKVIKGAPDSVRSLLLAQDDKFLISYDQMIEDLGSKGIRMVAMAVKDVTHSAISETLFPRGLPESKKKSLKYIAKARKAAISNVHVGDFENSLHESMNFVGFACFDASLRPSTPRIISDIRRSGTDVCMLTGDGTAAALSVARLANFFDDKCKQIASLQIKKDRLIWIFTRLKNGHTYEDKFNIETVERVIANQNSCACAIIIAGDAMERLLDVTMKDNIATNHMLNNLDKVAVISRASPQTKQQTLSILNSRCGRKTLMCGDGVNDISAMKTADISAALLNGFGEEANIGSDFDTENERRIAKLKYKKIGRHRDAADFGTERHSRIKSKLEEAFLVGKENPDNGINAILNIAKEEYARSRELRKGGGAAARILQEEDSLRKSMISKSSTENEKKQICTVPNVKDSIDTVKPGESSLAAQFTFLRPCIDGADAIIRVGVAAAAYSLSSHRSIALNSLMACYNLASLYKDGFRYGKYMWNVELTFIMAMDQGLSEISCSPRSRIPRMRPHDSIFHPAVASSILLQALIHLFVLSKGVEGARQMETHISHLNEGLRIRFSHSLLQGMNIPLIEDDNGSTRNVLGRVPFRPNLVTNVVFLLSVFQNAMISAVNHSGLLFQGSLLESRSFCMWASISIIFCIMMVLEVQPSINEMLQLAPMNSRTFRSFMLSLIIFDGLASFLADQICIYFLDKEQWAELSKVNKSQPLEDSVYAADIENKLLQAVRQKNLSFVQRIVIISFFFIMKSRV
jgi:cation-transporting ATPase 13A1